VQAAGDMLAEDLPHLFWVPCAAHCLDLCLEDIGKLAPVEEIIKEGRELVTFVKNHQMPLSLFRDLSKLELLKPGGCRGEAASPPAVRSATLVSVGAGGKRLPRLPSAPLVQGGAAPPPAICRVVGVRLADSLLNAFPLHR
jgi:hypothetical protein